MQIGGIAWWLLPGMFGFGAAVGLIISIVVARSQNHLLHEEWWGPLFWMLFSLVLIVVAMPLGGIAAVALTFAAHHAGWDRPLPYLAGSGLVFLTLLASWIVTQKYSRPGCHKQANAVSIANRSPM